MVEIFKHKERIVAFSKASEDEVHEILYKILSKINFVNEESISAGSFIEAYRLELWTKDGPLKRISKAGF